MQPREAQTPRNVILICRYGRSALFTGGQRAVNGPIFRSSPMSAYLISGR